MQAFHVPISANPAPNPRNTAQQQNFAPAAMLAKEAETAVLIL
jgi:hypothetical protein